jgi:hypothetical protein
MVDGFQSAYHSSVAVQSESSVGTSSWPMPSPPPLIVRRYPPVATEHDRREILLRSVDRMRHWGWSVPLPSSLSACTPLTLQPTPYLTLLDSTAPSWSPSLSARAGKHDSKNPRRWPNIHHLSNSEPLSTSTAVRHRRPEARSRHSTRRREGDGQEETIRIFRPERAVSRYEQIACAQPLCQEATHIPELNTHRLLVIHCPSGMHDILISR